MADQDELLETSKKMMALARKVQVRLGTKAFCKAWMRAGEETTNWSDFVHKFRKYAADFSGNPAALHYGEHLIKARIAKYETQMAGVRGVNPPKYPKERTPVAVHFFKNPEAEREW